MRKIVVDTSVFIDFSRAKTGLYSQLFELFNDGLCELYLPTVVISELWAGRSMSRKSVLSETIKMISKIERVELDEKIAKTAGWLLRKKQIRGFDAIVAATALELGAEIATQNEKHFKNVQGLRIFKPKEN
jgi:predicted nucleic acid-binding protein